MKVKQTQRITHEEKMGRVQDYFANMLENGIYITTMAQICHNCHLPNNGHTGTAIMAVCENFKEATILHKIEIKIGGRVRYEIELLP